MQHNSFLATEKTYKNLVLKVKFKLRNGNSGVQYRSKSYPDFVVKGYQADIADNMFMGILYEEGGSRGILVNVKSAEVAEHIHKDDWNEYVITADGPHITQVLNGFTTVDYTEKSEQGATDGIIALQLHVGPKMHSLVQRHPDRRIAIEQRSHAQPRSRPLVDCAARDRRYANWMLVRHAQQALAPGKPPVSSATGAASREAADAKTVITGRPALIGVWAGGMSAIVGSLSAQDTARARAAKLSLTTRSCSA